MKKEVTRHSCVHIPEVSLGNHRNEIHILDHVLEKGFYTVPPVREFFEFKVELGTASYT